MSASGAAGLAVAAALSGVVRVAVSGVPPLGAGVGVGDVVAAATGCSVSVRSPASNFTCPGAVTDSGGTGPVKASRRSSVPPAGVAGAVRPGQEASAAEVPCVTCTASPAVPDRVAAGAGSSAVTPARGMVTSAVRAPGWMGRPTAALRG